MAAGMLFMSGYHLWGDIAHEWVGAGVFALFIVHHILNLSFYKNIFKGKFSAYRITLIIVDFLALAVMLALMYSGITMSRHVFAFLKIESGLALARKLHILGSYWGILIMGLHLGLHWSILLNAADKKLKIKFRLKIKKRYMLFGRRAYRVLRCVCSDKTGFFYLYVFEERVCFS